MPRTESICSRSRRTSRFTAQAATDGFFSFLTCAARSFSPMPLAARLRASVNSSGGPAYRASAMAVSSSTGDLGQQQVDRAGAGAGPDGGAVALEAEPDEARRVWTGEPEEHRACWLVLLPVGPGHAGRGERPVDAEQPACAGGHLDGALPRH